jgi:enoyl-CoA hydratase/carnithine racemase
MWEPCVIAQQLASGLEAQWHGSLVMIRMHRAPTKNAFDLDHALGLLSVVESLHRMCAPEESSPAHSQSLGALAILSDQDGVWASGGDLQEIGTTPDRARQTMATMAKAAKMLKTLPLLSIAVLNGRAIGGGAELALACDERWIADDRATLELRQREWGLPAGWDGLDSLTNHLGSRGGRRAAALEFVRGRSWSAKELLHEGLASRDVRHQTNTLVADLMHHASQISACSWELRQAYLMFKDQDPKFDDFWYAKAHQEALQGYQTRRAKR